jgi:hypothetical protein
MKLVLASLALVLGACFDSLVSDPCATGYGLSHGSCVPLGGVDAGRAATPDASSRDPVDAAVPDALVCTAPEIVCRGACVNSQADPDNCGGCGQVCASGVCSAGACSGALRGHVIAIGHDYRSRHAAMARVLGNAVALGAHADVALGRLHGTADPAATAGTTAAIASAMAAIGRPFHATDLPATPTASTLTGLDVVVLDAQAGAGAATESNGAAWKSALAAFLDRGGVVIVLEGSAGVSYRFAIGATLYTVGAPLDVTGQLATVADGADVTTQQVVSPYRAEASSVALPGTQHAVITSDDGGTIVFHLIR